MLRSSAPRSNLPKFNKWKNAYYRKIKIGYFSLFPLNKSVSVKQPVGLRVSGSHTESPQEMLTENKCAKGHSLVISTDTEKGLQPMKCQEKGDYIVSHQLSNKSNNIPVV